MNDREERLTRHICARLLVGSLTLCAMAGAGMLPSQAQSQPADQGNMILAQQRQDPVGSFFRNLFGGFQPRRVAPPPPPHYYDPSQPTAPRQQQQQPPRQRSSGEPAPQRQRAPQPPAVVQKAEDARQVVVFGDFFAAGLKDGLEDAFSESADVKVQGEDNALSGLVRNDHFNWPKVITEYLEDPEKKIDVAVIMVGGNDRQPLSDAAGEHQPRSERWRELYIDRVDTILRLFLDRGIQVYWVGLPPAESARLSQHYSYFNDLYRERAYRAGGEYIDIWNSFVGEDGNYTAHGPDLNGENRQLRNDDGLHFTAAGNRKLAHFVSRDIRRDIGRDGEATIALPAGPIGPQPFMAGEEEQETGIGQVVTLTGPRASTSALAGGLGVTPRPPDDSAYFRNVLRGEAPEPKPGRSDDFRWRPDGSAGAGERSNLQRRSEQEAAPSGG